MLPPNQHGYYLCRISKVFRRITGIRRKYDIVMLGVNKLGRHIGKCFVSSLVFELDSSP